MKFIKDEWAILLKKGLREKGDVFLANCALKIAKLSVNCTCIGPYYKYKKPEALKNLA